MEILKGLGLSKAKLLKAKLEFPDGVGEGEGPTKETFRTVSPFATAHMFCAPRDSPRNFGFQMTLPGKINSFCAVYNYAEKAGLGKRYWHPRRKVGVAMHFSETIKLKFGEKIHTIFWHNLSL